MCPVPSKPVLLGSLFFGYLSMGSVFLSPLPSGLFLPCLVVWGLGEGPNISKEHTVSGESEPVVVSLLSEEEGLVTGELCIWVLRVRSALLRTSS